MDPESVVLIEAAKQCHETCIGRQSERFLVHDIVEDQHVSAGLVEHSKWKFGIWRSFPVPWVLFISQFWNGSLMFCMFRSESTVDNGETVEHVQIPNWFRSRLAIDCNFMVWLHTNSIWVGEISELADIHNSELLLFRLATESKSR
jgi:hypothetical protein